MKRLVLVGAGHSHAEVLRRFAAARPASVSLTLVSPHTLAPYSGMVPGWLAGHYRWEEICLDFAALSGRAGAVLIRQAAAGIDTAQSRLILADGRRLPYDFLSLDIGSTLNPPASEDTAVLPLRPLAGLSARWQSLLEHIRGLEAGSVHRVVMAGGGAAGVESVLAVQHRLTGLAPQVRFDFTLATRSDGFLPGATRIAAWMLRRHLKRHGIECVQGFSVAQIRADSVLADDGRELTADSVLWATGAQAFDWPQASGLSAERGFIRVDAALRSISHANVFASGDCAAWQPPLPKAGVYAVRMGPVLAHNLRAAIDGKPLIDYMPQRRYLALIGTGGAHAVAAWGPFAWQGDWVWRWKQRIDRRFLDRYRGGAGRAAATSIDTSISQED